MSPQVRPVLMFPVAQLLNDQDCLWPYRALRSSRILRYCRLFFALFGLIIAFLFLTSLECGAGKLSNYYEKEKLNNQKTTPLSSASVKSLTPS